MKAFARCFRSLAGRSPPIVDPALRDELRDIVDHFHEVYQSHFIAPFRGNPSTIFSRSIAFMALAYVDMLAATNDSAYPAALSEACEIIVTFERQNPGMDGDAQSGFLMGQEDSSLPYADCHSSCLLALVKGTALLDEPAWLESIDRGLAAYRLDTIKLFFLGWQKQDIVGMDFRLRDGSSVRTTCTGTSMPASRFACSMHCARPRIPACVRSGSDTRAGSRRLKR